LGFEAGGVAMKFEYLVGGLTAIAPPEEQQTKLNEMGRAGWELVSTAITSGFVMMYFKRPVAEPGLEKYVQDVLNYERENAVRREHLLPVHPKLVSEPMAPSPQPTIQ
jgi:hypothetical protein